MSYEYSITGNVNAPSLYEKIKFLMEASPDYSIIESNQNSSSFRNAISDMVWDSDIDLSFSHDSVFLDIHSGSARKLLKYLDDSLEKIDIYAQFHEL